MKKQLLISVAVLLIGATSVMADVPHMINYQGYLTDTGGEALDTTVAMTFSLYNAVTLGTLLWTETQPTCTVQAGRFSVLLGSINAIPNSVFDDTLVWLGITVGDDSEMESRTHVVSVAYAYRVGTVDDASGGIISGDVNIEGKGNIGSGNTNPGTYAFVTGENGTASGDYSTVGGGYSNTAGGESATVGGGWDNTASSEGATVGGGSSNSAINDNATVGGGGGNTADGVGATVGGGSANTVIADGATVSGGVSNDATGNRSVIGGGALNSARSDYGTVSGGYRNVDSSSSYGTIAGGRSNLVGGDYAAVPGGYNNVAHGQYSFAAGRRAKANHDGCFVWGDATNADITSNNVNQIRMRGAGGTIIYSNAGMTAGVQLAAGGNGWIGVSDSTKKRNIRLVDTKEVLDKVAQLPIKQWSYKSQEPSIEHIGPMAQDFWKLFHLGEDSLGISTIDPDGIALAAIQELHKENQQLKKELSELRSLVEKMASNQTDNQIKTASATSR
ncbi:tail fiber domain-containing protein, partial [bacterium]|nr:tail fiber domain-containing protein [bacterium]